MKSILTAKKINELPIEKQLAFYKSHFQGLHCELDSCGAEVSHDWGIYRGRLYCQDCFEWKQNDDKQKAQLKIDQLKAEVLQLQREFNLDE